MVSCAVRSAAREIASAIHAITASLKKGGRLVYFGAGTSGRLGVLDASECPPTFGTDPRQVVGVIAGGDRALRTAAEGAEDREEDGKKAVRELLVEAKDTLVGISASGVTPFVLAALEEGKKLGAATVLLTCNPEGTVPRPFFVDTVIRTVVGPELLTGSTRLKAGTATKLVLNMLSTLSMVGIGKVYGNLMVDVQPNCRKLEDRARRILEKALAVSPEKARELLDASGRAVKVAIVMHQAGVDREHAASALEQHAGLIRPAVAGQTQLNFQEDSQAGKRRKGGPADAAHSQAGARKAEAVASAQGGRGQDVIDQTVRETARPPGTSSLAPMDLRCVCPAGGGGPTCGPDGKMIVLEDLRRRRPLLILGLMSGTSADGLDLALVEIRPGAPPPFSVRAFATVPYPSRLRGQILAAGKPGTARDLCRLNFVLGYFYSVAVRRFLDRNGFLPGDVALIVSPGQTVWHVPGQSTLQIGEADLLRERIGIAVLSDLRPRDVAAGGQGAPLIPLVDYLLFRHLGEPVAALNLGGIANITVLTPEGVVAAFDTGPANCLIDEAAELVSGGKLRYDEGGRLGRGGRRDRALLETLLRHPYFALPPPKSTGRETFHFAALRALTPLPSPSPDLVATLTHLTAESVRIGLTHPSLPVKPRRLIVSGGGAENPFLLALLSRHFRVETSADHGVDPKAKEAIGFALLGYESLMGRPGNVPVATGARRAVVLGKWSL